MSIISHFECTVCCGEQPIKQQIACLFCKYATCLTCVQRFLLDSESPKCMSCSKAWDDVFLRTYLPAKWLDGQFKKHLKSSLFAHAKSEFPQLMIAAKLNNGVMELDKRNKLLHKLEKDFKATKQFFPINQFKSFDDISLEDVEYNILEAIENGENDDVISQWNLIHTNKAKFKTIKQYTKFLSTTINKYLLDFGKLMKIIEEVDEHYGDDDYVPCLYSKYNQTWVHMRLVTINILLHYPKSLNKYADQEILKTLSLSYEKSPNYNPNKKITSKSEYVKQCVRNDCRGFVASKDWKCSLCNTTVCSDCYELKEGKHSCKDDDVKTANLLKSDTKPCPNCKTSIFRTYGCDNMFCTKCKTGFNWRTLEILTVEQNDNPYMIQYLSNLNRPVQTSDVAVLNANYQVGVVNYGRNDGWEQNEYDHKYNTTKANVKLLHRLAEGDNSVCVNLNFDILARYYFNNKNISYESYYERKYGDMHIVTVLTVLRQLKAEGQYEINLCKTKGLTQTKSQILNLKFICGELDEKQFNIQLAKQHKAGQHASRLHDLASMLRSYADDTMMTLMRMIIQGKQIQTKQIIGEINKMVDIFNQESRKLCNIYGYTVHRAILVDNINKRGLIYIDVSVKTTIPPFQFI